MVKRNIIANFAGRGWTNLLGLICVPLYLKFLGIEAYGLVGFFVAVRSVSGLLDLGIGLTTTRELARLAATDGTAREQRDLVRTLETIYWGLAAIAGSAIVAAAHEISTGWLNVQDLPVQVVCDAVRLMGVALALEFAGTLYQGGLMGLQRQEQVNIIIAGSGTVRAGGAVLLLWLVWPDIRIFFLWQIVVSAISTAASAVLLRRNIPVSDRSGRFRLSIVRELWRYAAAVSANSFVGTLLSQLDKAILSKMLTLTMFGYYTVACTAASAIWSVIVPFNSAVFPQFVKLNEQREEETLRLFFHKSSQALSVLLLPLCLVLAFFSREILLLWTSRPEVAEYAHTVVSILVLGTMLNGMVSVPSYAASAFGWPQLIAVTNWVQAFMLVPLIWFLASRYGAVGAAVAWLVQNSIYLLVMTPIFFRRYLREEQSAWYLNDQLVPLLLVSGTVWALSAAIPPRGSKLGTVVWLTFTWMLATAVAALSVPYVRLAFWTFCRARTPWGHSRERTILGKSQ
jgi:O-antigen/teichoic acid export membrane protein